jgi:predicted Zn-dependent protease
VVDFFGRIAGRAMAVVLAPEGVRGVPLFGRVLRRGAVVCVVLLLALGAIGALAGGSISAWVTDKGQAAGVLGGVPAQTMRGIDAYKKGEIGVAERELSQAAKTYPRSAMALLYLARIRVDAGDADRAAAYLGEAVARDPESAVAHRMLGEYHLTRARRMMSDGASATQALSELGEAESQLSSSVSLNPVDQRARGYHACVLGMLGRTDQARDAFAAAGSGPWEDCVRLPAP